MARKKQLLLTFWEIAEAVPPILVRLLASARRNSKLTDTDIARAMGVDVVDVWVIENRTDWRGVDLPAMKSYLRACGVDFCDGKSLHRIRLYLAITSYEGRPLPAWQNLRRSPEWKSKWEPMVMRYRKSMKPKTK